MLRGTRPTAALVASLVVSTAALTACGTDTPGTGLEFADRLDAVTISGDVGDAKLEFKKRMEAGELETETLVEGGGDALKDKDAVFVNYVIGNGYTKTDAINSFGEDASAVEVTVGAAETAEPATLDDVLKNLLRDYIKPGVTKGSRIVLTGNTEAMFGQLAQSPALATEGIGNDDGLVMVVDVEDVTVLDGPEGEVGKNPGWAPKIVFNGNGPTSLDFAGIAKPAGKAKLLVSVLKKGTGAEVKTGDLLVANYLGSVYGATTPFDESYSPKKPLLKLPVGSFVDGFNEAIEGQTVGSRVIMRIPPAKGYGKEGQGETVPPNSTLYFVVDILAAV
ncbi:FKBP-type peptidyl-prolyl cis-trans isomerase [Nocardioides sp.]|uniref:FKBP-type peptidyl-prolyl cis-trans isomerase n=1 Tax=Nocardioides sp. TaxID=35761 RepID=UPI0027185088|nr:FKBP-type peptidyl-prolyl cis-trans isomerase [Nocardioides sp.]MDO9454602.1 FKBP-type peptidyl-prolyl cis-trans isomerase [Nocardioides sp.]